MQLFLASGFLLGLEQVGGVHFIRVIAKVMSSEKTIFLGLLVIRLVNALLIQTFFVPDEFWQSMEVAHNMVFDYGYLTWEWRVGIRSYAYPLVMAALYKMMAVLGLDYRGLVIRGPRLLQGVIASVGDLYLYRLSGRVAGRQVAQWTLLCQLLSWFTAYCCTRTLSNGTETTLVIAALFYFPWPGLPQRRGDSRRFVALAAMSVVVRPTAAILWILMAAWHLQRCKGTAILAALRLYLSTGLAVLAVSTVIDRVWYGHWVLVHLNFLHFNVISGGSGFYGRHPWHWYVSQGAPVVLWSHGVPFLLGVRHAWRGGHNSVLLLLMLWHVFILSLLAHKEFRFLLPVLPLAMHYCGLYFHSASQPPPPPPSPPIQAGKGGKGEQGGGGESGQDGTEGETRVGEQRDTSTAEACDRMTGGEERNCWNSEEDRERKRTDEEDRAERRRGDSCEDASLSGQRLRPNPSSAGHGSLPTSAPGETSPLSPRGEEEEGEEKGRGEGIVGQSSSEGGLPSPESAVKGEHSAANRRARKVRCLMLLLALTNLPPLLYFSLIHQRGTVDVMTFLHQAALQGRGGEEGGGGVDVLFLMPCHSTPYYSHLHVNASLSFLTCEPNLHHRPNYTDEADLFYRDPPGWLRAQYGQSSLPLPSHLVHFNVLAANISDFLQQGGYTPCARFFHTHFPQGRVGSHVVVSCRQGGRER